MQNAIDFKELRRQERERRRRSSAESKMRSMTIKKDNMDDTTCSVNAVDSNRGTT